MNLTIDIGNTRTKIALFDGETFVREEKFENTDAEHLLNVVKEKEAEGLAFCSVAAENPLLVEALKQLPYPVLEVKGTTPRAGHRGLPHARDARSRPTGSRCRRCNAETSNRPAGR